MTNKSRGFPKISRLLEEQHGHKLQNLVAPGKPYFLVEAPEIFEVNIDTGDFAAIFQPALNFLLDKKMVQASRSQDGGAYFSWRPDKNSPSGPLY